jgi:hypothetical protein
MEHRSGPIRTGSRPQREGREGRTWKVAKADPQVLARIEAERAVPRETDAPVDDHRESPSPEAVIPDGSGEPAAEPALVGAEFAAQVRAHREGRQESMRARYEELASHQPGCKCAHHMGEK